MTIHALAILGIFLIGAVVGYAEATHIEPFDVDFDDHHPEPTP